MCPRELTPGRAGEPIRPWRMIPGARTTPAPSILVKQPASAGATVTRPLRRATSCGRAWARCSSRSRTRRRRPGRARPSPSAGGAADAGGSSRRGAGRSRTRFRHRRAARPRSGHPGSRSRAGTPPGRPPGPVSVRAIEPDATIADEDMRLDVGRPDDDLDGRFGRAVLDRIAEQVLHDQLEIRPIRLYDQVAWFAGERDRPARVAPLEGVDPELG